jgi:hypothetical protein
MIAITRPSWGGVCSGHGLRAKWLGRTRTTKEIIAKADAHLAGHECPFCGERFAPLAQEHRRTALARSYAQRTLTRQSITPADQSEGIVQLASARLGRSTGQIIHVEGGLHEAFLR